MASRNGTKVPSGTGSRGVDLVKDGLASGASNLWGIFNDNEGYFLELRVKARGEGDYYALAKKEGPAGDTLVAFGNGYDVLSALMGLNASIAQGKWQVDRPWSPSK